MIHLRKVTLTHDHERFFTAKDFRAHSTNFLRQEKVFAIMAVHRAVSYVIGDIQVSNSVNMRTRISELAGTVV
jgi:hypothetical protein